MAEEFTQDDVTRSYAKAVDLDARAAEVLADTSLQERAAVDPCKVWHDIRPIVVAVSELWFIPKNVRSIINLVVIIMDKLCP